MKIEGVVHEATGNASWTTHPEIGGK